MSKSAYIIIITSSLLEKRLGLGLGNIVREFSCRQTWTWLESLARFQASETSKSLDKVSGLSRFG